MINFLASDSATAAANFIALATAALVTARIAWRCLRPQLARAAPPFRKAQQAYLYTQLQLLRKYRAEPWLLAYDVGASAIGHAFAFMCLSYGAAYASITGYFDGARQGAIDNGHPDFFEIFIRMPDIWLDVANTAVQAIGVIAIFVGISFFISFRKVKSVATFDESRRKLVGQYIELRSKR